MNSVQSFTITKKNFSQNVPVAFLFLHAQLKQIAMTYLYDKSGIHFFQSGASRIVARQILLFELMNDYNFVQELENNLVRTSLNSINDLQLAFEFSYEDRCKVLRCATPCQAFFENLSKNKPKLSLQDIKDEVEIVMFWCA